MARCVSVFRAVKEIGRRQSVQTKEPAALGERPLRHRPARDSTATPAAAARPRSRRCAGTAPPASRRIPCAASPRFAASVRGCRAGRSTASRRSTSPATAPSGRPTELASIIEKPHHSPAGVSTMPPWWMALRPGASALPARTRNGGDRWGPVSQAVALGEAEVLAAADLLVHLPRAHRGNRRAPSACASRRGTRRSSGSTCRGSCRGAGPRPCRPPGAMISRSVPGMTSSRSCSRAAPSRMPR